MLGELGVSVFPVPIHQCSREGRFPVPKEADIIFCSNPLSLEIAVEYKKRLNKLLVLQFLDIPIELFGSEQWRIQAYDRIKPLIEHVDYSTAISKYTAKCVKEWCGRYVDRVLYLGVDIDVFGAFEPQTERNIVGICRGNAKQKHAEKLVESAKKTNIPLEIIYGQYSDIQKAKVISKCLFGVGASSLEGFGIYVCEFAYYSKPFIAYKLPVFEEIWGNSICYVNDADEMDEKIRLFAKNNELRREKGKEMHAVLIKKKLTLQNYATKLQKILENYI
ncbi:MAG: glycosyltransferase [Candidatus Thermoplasmatota archaeon]